MAGGTRFEGSRPPAGRVIDVKVVKYNASLYEVLAIEPTATQRDLVARARELRRGEPDSVDIHDVCLAEAVLGRRHLRAEYDALLARLRAAKQPVPRIGAATEGSALGPSIGERARKVARKIFSLLLPVGAIVGVVAVAMCTGGNGSSRYNRPEITIPKLDYHPIMLPTWDPKMFEIPKFDYHPIELPKPTLPTLPPRHSAMPRQ